jgi:hypothetical protein
MIKLQYVYISCLFTQLVVNKLLIVYIPIHMYKKGLAKLASSDQLGTRFFVENQVLECQVVHRMPSCRKTCCRKLENRHIVEVHFVEGT